jgi:hypothetical protein
MSGLDDFGKAEMNNKKQYSRRELHLKTIGVENGPARVSLLTVEQQIPWRWSTLC